MLLRSDKRLGTRPLHRLPVASQQNITPDTAAQPSYKCEGRWTAVACLPGWSLPGQVARLASYHPKNQAYCQCGQVVLLCSHRKQDDGGAHCSGSLRHPPVNPAPPYVNPKFSVHFDVVGCSEHNRIS